MTTLDHRAATTPRRLRLPVDLVTELETIATAEGIGVEELVSRLLVDVLPGMVAQRTARWLRTTLSLAYPIDVAADVPGIREGRPDNGRMRHAVISPDTANAEVPPAIAEGTPNPQALQPQVTPSITPGDLDAEDVSGDTAL
ncbi:MAG: hypothetical protein ACLPR9_04510 [Acidimicrobiales bacterium]